MNPLWASLGFFTRLPVPAVLLPPETWPRMLGWAPVAGWLVGGLAAAVAVGAGAWMGPWVGATLALAVQTWATGGLHLDGFSDCVDGLLCNGDRERTLAVMRDAHAGGLGAAWTALWLLIRAALTARCLELSPALAAGGLVFGATFARSRLAMVLRTEPAATPGRGLAASLEGLGTADGLRALLLFAPVLLACALGLPSWRWPVVLVGALVLERVWLRVWRARIGGVSGDVLGALVQGVEVWTLAVLAVHASS